MFQRLTKQQYEEQLDTVFTVVWDSVEPMELRLVNVRGVISTPRNEQFAIEFKSEDKRFLNQGIQLMKHPVFGELELFITPIGSEADGVVYEAAFNYLHKAADSEVATK